jgi:hypothetical protein
MCVCVSHKWLSGGGIVQGNLAALQLLHSFQPAAATPLSRCFGPTDLEQARTADRRPVDSLWRSGVRLQLRVAGELEFRGPTEAPRPRASSTATGKKNNFRNPRQSTASWRDVPCTTAGTTAVLVIEANASWRTSQQQNSSSEPYNNHASACKQSCHAENQKHGVYYAPVVGVR